jgi:ferredoxin
MNKNAYIAYYSCTQNTERLSYQMKKQLEAMNWEVKISRLQDFEVNYCNKGINLLIIGVPVHYWDMPEPALNLIRKLPTFTNTYGFVFSTYGKCVCNEVPFSLAKELFNKGIKVLGGAQIISPHSAKINGSARLGDEEVTYGKGHPDNNEIYLLNTTITKIINNIEKNYSLNFNFYDLKQLHTKNILAKLMNTITTNKIRQKFMPHVKFLKNNCSQCRKCEKSCDSNAIKIDEKFNFFFDKKLCNKCYKCIDKCDKNAIVTNWNQVIFWTRFVHILSSNTNTICKSVN